ncbi:hypothetical protein RRG08_057337 [Elysia crispata]|uniref:Uncharacterized protein n=1 Tax=Elysia crispata TaxID=231223 RepID=A0AAE1D0B2_9GAST|nr:hypothetical protein RRG08_057337 [Elysia crispata]
MPFEHFPGCPCHGLGSRGPPIFASGGNSDPAPLISFEGLPKAQPPSGLPSVPRFDNMLVAPGRACGGILRECCPRSSDRDRGSTLRRTPRSGVKAGRDRGGNRGDAKGKPSIDPDLQRWRFAPPLKGLPLRPPLRGGNVGMACAFQGIRGLRRRIPRETLTTEGFDNPPPKRRGIEARGMPRWLRHRPLAPWKGFEEHLRRNGLPHQKKSGGCVRLGGLGPPRGLTTDEHGTGDNHFKGVETLAEGKP